MSEDPKQEHGATGLTANGEDVAQYLAEMTFQLEAMARAVKLELLAYLLAIAHAEAEAIVLEGRMDQPSPPH